MARVNHKTVKRLMNEKRSKITDKQFFTSRILAGHFEDMAVAQTKRYHYNRRVRVNIYWKPKVPDGADTNNQVIRINAGNPIVTKVRGRADRYQIVCGLFSHELGHVLYTDFLCNQSYFNTLMDERWYPAAPELDTAKDKLNERAVWDYVRADGTNKQLFLKVAHDIWNVLEDGYIEHRFLNQFPGTLGYGLETLRERQWKMMPDVTQIKEQEEEGGHIFQSILQVMLSYALFGEIKYGDEPLTDERIQAIFGLIAEIDRAVMVKSAKTRYDVVNTILVRLWDYIEDYLEELKARRDEMTAAGQSISAEELLEAGMGSLTGTSTSATGCVSRPVADEEDSEEISSGQTAGSRAKTRADAEEAEEDSGSGETGEAGEDESGSGGADGTGEDESESGGADGTGDGESGDEGGEPPAKISGENESGDDGMIPPQKTGNAGKQKATEHEQGRIPLKQTSSVSNPVGGTVGRNEDYERECDERAAADIERMLDKMAERSACEQLENERLQELNETAQNISYGNIHEGVGIQVNRISRVDEDLVEQYGRIADPLLVISKQMQKSLVKQLKESRRGGKMTGLLMGRRLDIHALCRNDGKVFYKNSLPNEIPEMAVGLLLDESGSMSSCDRCTYARATAIILYDFCRGLDIPVMIYGHSTGYDASRHDVVDLYSYAEFESIDQDDQYRMMDIGARGGNRDGAALRFVAEQLSKRPEEVKILMIVSDGQPADTGYGGTAAEEDLRGIKQEYQRKNIIFVAAAIGDDKFNIERIYGDSFMDITDLNQLPMKLTGVVKRHIRL